MALDSTLFAVDVPAGTYTEGQIIQMKAIAGPAIVRDGYGPGKLKRIQTGQIGVGTVFGRIWVQNSDWIDPVGNSPGWMTSATALSDDSSCVQLGDDCEMQPNSGWNCYVEIISGGSPTRGTSFFALIDIDYPKISAITDPQKMIGIPTTIKTKSATGTKYVAGALTTASWAVLNVDFLKAGFKYALQKLETEPGDTLCGFVAISGAAGMGGLSRIVPFNGNSSGGIRTHITYSSILTKGPMDIKTLTFDTSITENVSNFSQVLMFDWVKKSV